MGLENISSRIAETMMARANASIAANKGISSADLLNLRKDQVSFELARVVSFAGLNQRNQQMLTAIKDANDISLKYLEKFLVGQA